MTWTAEREQKLRDLWPDNTMSCAMIAEDIGMGKNAVIGKARRLGLGEKPSLYRTGSTSRYVPLKPKPAPKPKPVRNFGSVWSGYPDVPEHFVPRASDIIPLNISILDIRDGQCRYIAGDDRLCCGHAVKEGKPYCISHCSLVYYQPKARTEAQKAHDARMGDISRLRGSEGSLRAGVVEEAA